MCDHQKGVVANTSHTHTPHMTTMASSVLVCVQLPVAKMSDASCPALTSPHMTTLKNHGFVYQSFNFQLLR